MICPNPKCKANTFKKVLNEDGTHYYYCSICAYKTLTINLKQITMSTVLACVGVVAVVIIAICSLTGKEIVVNDPSPRWEDIEKTSQAGN